MITREEAQAKFREYPDAQGPHDEVYTDGSKIEERVGAAAVINRHFQNGKIAFSTVQKKVTLQYLNSWKSLLSHRNLKSSQL